MDIDDFKEQATAPVSDIENIIDELDNLIVDCEPESETKQELKAIKAVSEARDLLQKAVNKLMLDL